MKQKLIIASIALFSTAVLGMGQPLRDNSDNYQFFFGAGACYIESLPCADGRPISCSASGISGGLCEIEENNNAYIAKCMSYQPSASVMRSCKK